MNYYSFIVGCHTYECTNRHNKKLAIREVREFVRTYYVGVTVRLIVERGAVGNFADTVATFVRSHNDRVVSYYYD